MRTFANSEYPDEMPHTAAFHQGLHCLLTKNLFSDKETDFFGNHMFVCSFMENSIGLKMVKYR